MSANQKVELYSSAPPLFSSRTGPEQKDAAAPAQAPQTEASRSSSASRHYQNRLVAQSAEVVREEFVPDKNLDQLLLEMMNAMTNLLMLLSKLQSQRTQNCSTMADLAQHVSEQKLENFEVEAQKALENARQQEIMKYVMMGLGILAFLICSLISFGTLSIPMAALFTGVSAVLLGLSLGGVMDLLANAMVGIDEKTFGSLPEEEQNLKRLQRMFTTLFISLTLSAGAGIGGGLCNAACATATQVAGSIVSSSVKFGLALGADATTQLLLSSSSFANDLASVIVEQIPGLTEEQKRTAKLTIAMIIMVMLALANIAASLGAVGLSAKTPIQLSAKAPASMNRVGAFVYTALQYMCKVCANRLRLLQLMATGTQLGASATEIAIGVTHLEMADIYKVRGMLEATMSLINGLNGILNQFVNDGSKSDKERIELLSKAFEGWDAYAQSIAFAAHEAVLNS